MTDTRQQETDHEEKEPILTQDEGEQGESKTTRKVSRKRAAPQQKFATPQPNPMEYVQQFMFSQMALMNHQEEIRREREDKRCEREDKRREDERAQYAQE